MVSATGGHRSRRKAHFLKPTVTLNTGTISELPSDCLSPKSSSKEFKDLSEKVFLRGWALTTERWQRWVKEMQSKYLNLWKRVSIYEAVMSSTYVMYPYEELLLCISERWCPDTNTFIFPWGETIVTLEDVMVCGGYSVLGESVLSPLETKQLVEVEEKLIEVLKEVERGVFPDHNAWMDYFMGTEHDLEHEAFLSLWLSKYVFVKHESRFKHVFERLAFGLTCPESFSFCTVSVIAGLGLGKISNIAVDA